MQNGTLLMVERQEPRFQSFAAGDVVEGVLTEIRRVTVKGNIAVRYTVRQDDDTYVCFLGAYQIDTKLRTSDTGHRVSIACIGADTSVRRGGNCMKVFKVHVSNEPASLATPAKQIKSSTCGASE